MKNVFDEEDSIVQRSAATNISLVVFFFGVLLSTAVVQLYVVGVGAGGKEGRAARKAHRSDGDSKAETRGGLWGLDMRWAVVPGSSGTL